MMRPLLWFPKSRTDEFTHGEEGEERETEMMGERRIRQKMEKIAVDC